jgi:formylglycine-generating enzyme required for sulfatase activity
VVARVQIAKTRVELGLRPDEADRLALELAKMQLADSAPRMGAPDLAQVTSERRAWLEVAMPAHAVEVGAFEIDVYPVTNAEWAAFARATGAATPSRDGAADAFVTGVSWQEAQAYARHHGAELPTEAEWECAARPDRRLFTWGDTYAPAGDIAFTPPVLETYRVGSRPATASPRGIHDLLGQFGEYTASSFGPYPGADVAAFEKLYPQWRGQRVQRGGYDVHQDATCVSRRGVPEGERRTHIKFRCVRR